jgi:hypothetical protein
MIEYLKTVNKHFQIDIKDQTRKYEYVVARACYYKICREIGGYSYARIGRSVNKGHATVLHALAELPNILRHDIPMAKKCQLLFNKYDFYNKKKNEKSLNELLVEYNIMVLENDQLKNKIDELTQTIYRLADLD